VKVTVREGFPEVEVLIQCPEATEDIRRLEALVLNSSPKLLCTKDDRAQPVDRREILYIESVDKRCFVYLTDEVFETDFRLYELEEMLDAAGFFRSAKSQLINIGKLKSLCPDFGGRIEAELENGERVIISRQYAKAFKERIGLR